MRGIFIRVNIDADKTQDTREGIETMEDVTVDDLSEAEINLITDFIEWAGKFDRQVLDLQTIDGDADEVDLQEAMEFLIPLLSQKTTEFDSHAFQLLRLEQEIQRGPTFEYENKDEIPPNATVTPDKINGFLKQEELEQFFTIAGQMIEVLTVELIMDEIVSSSRQSKKVRNKIARKSQREREWLLHVTGQISDGQKGEMRRLYDLRSSAVHSSEDSNDFLRDVNIPSDLSRARGAINTLHMKTYGINLSERLGDLIT